MILNGVAVDEGGRWTLEVQLVHLLLYHGEFIFLKNPG